MIDAISPATIELLIQAGIGFLALLVLLVFGAMLLFREINSARMRKNDDAFRDRYFDEARQDRQAMRDMAGAVTAMSQTVRDGMSDLGTRIDASKDSMIRRIDTFTTDQAAQQEKRFNDMDANIIAAKNEVLAKLERMEGELKDLIAFLKAAPETPAAALDATAPVDNTPAEQKDAA